MAEIFSASLHGIHEFKKPLCVKCILPSLCHDPEFVEMFVNEAKILASLIHPNIIQVYDFGCEKEIYYLAMEYVDGADLSRLVEVRKAKGLGVWPMGFVAHVARSVLQALDFAHRFSWEGKPLCLIHRDISPQNILVAREGFVKLTDFGVAKIHEAWGSKTKTGVLKGKFAYMSPEQIQGQKVDQRSDLYSLGIVLHELLSGKRFYGEGTAPEIIMRAAQLKEIPPLPAGEGCTKEFAGFIHRMLARNPEDRFSSAGEALETLGKLGVEDAQEIDARRVIEHFFDRETGTLLLPTRVIPGRENRPMEYPEVRRSSSTAVTFTMEAKGVSKETGSSSDEPGEPAVARDTAEDRQDSQAPSRRRRERGMPRALMWIVTGLMGVIIGAGGVAILSLAPTPVHPVGSGLKKNPLESIQESPRAVPQVRPLPDSGSPGIVNHEEPPVERPAVKDETRTRTGSRGEKSQEEPTGRPKGSGTVTILAKPWAEVWIDGHKVGITPVNDYRVSAGKHSIELVNQPGGMRRKLPIAVHDGEALNVFEDLFASTGKTKITR